MKISIKPIVTEKATALQEQTIIRRKGMGKDRISQYTLNRYTFRVSPKADKNQIKTLIEDLYGVEVVKINTLVVRGKNKSRYTKSGLLRGKTNSYKKAIVTLKEGQTIDFYSNI